MTDPNRHIQAVPEPTLVEFLNARLDEEQEAWAGGAGLVTQLNFAKLSGYMLRDIEAKREIIKWCGERDQIWVGTIASDPEHPSPKDFVPGRLKNPADSRVLRYLASVYSDHPQYDEGWKP